MIKNVKRRISEKECMTSNRDSFADYTCVRTHSVRCTQLNRCHPGPMMMTVTTNCTDSSVSQYGEGKKDVASVQFTH